VPLTPESVEILAKNGHRVLIETKAGEGAHFYDNDYSEAGADIAYDNEKVFEADIICKVAPPSNQEIEMLKMQQMLVSPIHLPTLKENYVRKLMNKKITALAFEYIKDDSDSFPFVRSMSEIAGSTSILLAAEYLSETVLGKGLLLGGISGVPPADVVILGAGVVGEFATRTALGLGAQVKVFDNNMYKLMRLQNDLGRRVYTSIIYPKLLAEALKSADVVVGAIHSPSGRSPVIVSEEMVAAMKAGSIIMDVSIDQGGIFETSELTSHADPTFKKFDVIHYCVPNIASRVARTASYAISNILTVNLLKASRMGGFEKLLRYDINTRHGVYLFRGCLTNEYLSQKFNIKFTDLELLFTANI